MITQQHSDNIVRHGWSGVFDLVPEPIALLDCDQRVVAVNRTMAAIMGREPIDCCGEYCYKLIHGTVNPPGECPFPQAMACGTSLSSQISASQLGGCFQVTVTPVLDEEGRIIGGLHTGHDVTLLRRAEHNARESERRYRLLAEHSKDVIWTMDLDGRFTYVSPSVERLRGYRPDQVLAQTLAEAVCPGSLEIVVDGLRQIRELHRRGERIVTPPLIVEQPCRDGSTVWTEVVVEIIEDEAGALSQILGVSRDISERRRAEEYLRESEDKYRTLVENSHDLVFIYRGDRCLFANRRALDLTGYTEDEAGRMSIWDVLHAEDRERVIGYGTRRACGEMPPGTFTARIVDRHGDAHWMEFAMSPVNFLGQPAVLGLARDITDRVRTEDERLEMERRFQHMQKLESLGVLAGGIAHDFNNLLMAMLGHLELALLELTPDGLARLHVGEAKKTAQRAADLTRQMLAYSGRGRFQVECVDLNGLVNEMSRLLRTSISRNAELKLELAHSLPRVEADPAQLEQIVMNLVLNASEAIHSEKGHITICTGSLYLDPSQLNDYRSEAQPRPGQFVFLEISDDGTGMDQTTQERLFEPFFTTKFTGRGLGLAAVMGIVRGHTGALSVASTPGKGTTVRVLLPVAQGTSAEPASATPQHPARTLTYKAAVLVVDDEETVRHVAARMLDRLGFTALSASSGQEAVNLVRSADTRIDCVLLDLTMPGLDGIATLELLRAIRPDLPVILSSGYDRCELEEFPSVTTGVSFLQKPYALNQLQEELLDLLSPDLEYDTR